MPVLNTILFDDSGLLRAARMEHDERIANFFERAGEELLTRSIPYVNNQGRTYVEQAGVAVAQFFNHQTHRFAQIHSRLTQTRAPPPSLDLHRIINP